MNFIFILILDRKIYDEALYLTRIKDHTIRTLIHNLFRLIFNIYNGRLTKERRAHSKSHGMVRKKLKSDREAVNQDDNQKRFHLRLIVKIDVSKNVHERILNRKKP